eukprot:TRINITY_DN8131_c0_g1_i1.p1 TRINITY_DN8131_c0_g1~~TRINITY_DN8131_c0_g1_i1.p1  ORF type:complete len:389 (+),score=90.84 TRINITY_DN8131_c0_g1_i1:248-1414(+)
MLIYQWTTVCNFDRLIMVLGRFNMTQKQMSAALLACFKLLTSSVGAQVEEEAFPRLLLLALESICVYMVAVGMARYYWRVLPSFTQALASIPTLLLCIVLASDCVLDFSNVAGIVILGNATSTAVEFVDIILAYIADWATGERTTFARKDFAIVILVLAGMFSYMYGQGKFEKVEDHFYAGVFFSTLSAVCMQISVAAERQAVQLTGHPPFVMVLTHALAPFICLCLLPFAYYHTAAREGAAPDIPWSSEFPRDLIIMASVLKAGYMYFKLELSRLGYDNVAHTLVSALITLVKFGISFAGFSNKVTFDRPLATYGGVFMMMAASLVSWYFHEGKKEDATVTPWARGDGIDGIDRPVAGVEADGNRHQDGHGGRVDADLRRRGNVQRR